MQLNDLACSLQVRSHLDYLMETNANYQIRIKGRLDERWVRWFEGFEVTRHPNGETIISGPIDGCFIRN